MVKAQKFIITKRFEYSPKETDLQLVDEEIELQNINEGEFLAKALYLSVDPYMRAYASRLEIGSTMLGCQVALIETSRNNDFPVGKYVVGYFGWRTYTISDGSSPGLGFPPPYVLPDIGNLPVSLGLGTLGMTGNTAYFGFLEICKPKAGETVLVTGAAGAIGNHVGQIAKIKGCTVIGIAGSDEKCQWLKSIGFDHTINYKTANLNMALTEVAPRGIDCYFDNVGGEISSTIIQHMNQFGRISVCGAISSYNCDNLPTAPIIQPAMVLKQLEMRGFLIGFWTDRWFEGISENLQWVRSGKLTYKESVTEGFENMTKAFIGLFSGENIGKALIKV